jgi:hypothetical protein
MGKYKTIKQCAIAWLLRTVDHDADGRPIGYNYAHILAKVRQQFPVVEYSGPHKGKPFRMSIKELQRVAYDLRRERPDLRLPVRPRRRKRPQKK